jgi:tetratricopeptide (TPR) repeat protein
MSRTGTEVKVMSQAHESTIQPDLKELFRNHLRQQTEAHALGLGYAEPTDSVMPHDSTPMQPVDPRLAWADATAVATQLLPGQVVKNWPVAPDWSSLVAAQEPAFGLAFALGNFPQLVRNLQPLLAGEKLHPPEPGTSAPASGSLTDWAERLKTGPHALLVAGVLRLARQFDAAEQLLAQPVPPSAEPARANEQAAVAWHRGQAEQALALWKSQPESVPVLFNRGMAALFLGRTTDAIADLTRAVAALPETSAWHHLGRLYLALAAG